jgi:DNA-binding NarL/FixJ family response regulator
MIQVFVVDDHALIRQGLKGILAAESDIEVSGEAASIAELEALLEQNEPNVVILDLSMPGGNSLDALKGIHQMHPRVAVLVLSVHPADQYALRALKAGASGYISKEACTEELVKAIRRVAAGDRYITPEVGNLLASTLDGRANGRGSANHQILSDREFAVLMQIGEGKALTAIAREMSLSVKTISTYRSRLMKKMNFRSNAELIRYVLEHYSRG